LPQFIAKAAGRLDSFQPPTQPLSAPQSQTTTAMVMALAMEPLAIEYSHTMYRPTNFIK